MRVLYGIGRAIFGGFFVYNGINHFVNAEALEGYAASKRNPYPHLSVKASGVLMTAAGASLMTGVRPELSASTLAAFLAVTSVMMHDFWNVDDPQAKQADLIQFSKNIALIGSALAIAGAGESTDQAN